MYLYKYIYIYDNMLIIITPCILYIIFQTTIFQTTNINYTLYNNV